MGMMSNYDNAMREPTSTLWKVLKIVFLVLNIIVAVGICLAIAQCAILGAIAAGKGEIELPDGQKGPVSEEAKTVAKILLAVYVPLILFATLQMILGFIGVCRLHLGCLYVYTAFAIIGLILNIVASAKGVFAGGTVGQIGLILMMFFLIRELKQANGL